MQLLKDILQFANAQSSFTTQDAVIFTKKKYTRQYIQRLINELVEAGKLIKIGSTKDSRYVIPKKIGDLDLIFRDIKLNKNLQEHVVWDEVETKIPFKKILAENVHNFLVYAFSEMLNNAIDHSESHEIQIKIENSRNAVYFMIMDFGVGVFNNILKKYPKFKNAENVVQELLKGKLTTDPKKHTGEGIFFTSKVCDSFHLNSDGHQFVIDKETGEYGYKSIAKNTKGTTVFCEIKKYREDTLNGIFEKYYMDLEEPAFDKTEIKINLYAIGRACISRSQARRVLARLENFKKVILDFDNVFTVGQGFADEIFRVYKFQNPKIEIEPINMKKSVEFMVKRAME